MNTQQERFEDKLRADESLNRNAVLLALQLRDLFEDQAEQLASERGRTGDRFAIDLAMDQLLWRLCEFWQNPDPQVPLKISYRDNGDGDLGVLPSHQAFSLWHLQQFFDRPFGANTQDSFERKLFEKAKTAQHLQREADAAQERADEARDLLPKDLWNKLK